jgi:hypothetical protein
MALINGFFAATCIDISKQEFRPLLTVLWCTGDDRVSLTKLVIFSRDWCQSQWMTILAWWIALSSSFDGLSDRGAFLWWPLSVPLETTILGQEAGHLRTYRVLDDFYRLR